LNNSKKDSKLINNFKFLIDDAIKSKEKRRTLNIAIFDDKQPIEIRD